MLEYGFAYAPGGDKLAGKTCLLAVTAGAPQDSYHEDATNRFALPTLLSPLQQTIHFCQMEYLPPYVLFSSLSAKAQGRNEAHAKGYERLLLALRDDQFDADAARNNTQALREAMKNDRSTLNNRAEGAWTPHGAVPSDEHSGAE